MPKKSVILVFLLLLLPLLLAAPGRTAAGRQAAADTGSESIPSQDLWLEGRDFATGRGERTLLDAGGLTLAPSATSAVYISPPLTAPIPFNTVVPQWRGTGLADPATFRLYLRTGDPLAEAEWVEVGISDDMTLPGDEVMTGNFHFVPDLRQTHEQLQVRLEFQRPDGAPAPRLEQLRLTFIDSSGAPTVEEAINRQRALTSPTAVEDQEATADYPKPFVVSRDVWCPDVIACNYSDGLSYYPVSHLILHHTVTSGTDPIAVLQAIWRFHTFTRGWGDIGYNYLVDPAGVLYEGHLGGDNVVGTHSGAANRGSMALSMIGDYTSVLPSAAMQESIANLFAWKADQMDIDVYDSSYLPEMEWGLSHLVGHRDVYGTTACPGDSAHPLLPAIRDGVARRLGFSPPHLYYDELSPASHFVKSDLPGDDDYWWDGPRGCGFNTHAYYTWSVTETAKSTNWAEWRPEVPASGRYELSVFAPYCYTKRADTAGAVYEVTDTRGTSRITVDQGANLGIWVPLGQFEFAAGTAGKVRLTDLTPTDSGLGVWFDAIRLRPLAPLPPEVTDMVPVAGTWSLTGNVNFSWTVAHDDTLASQSFQLATDYTFGKLLVNAPLPASTRSLVHPLPDGRYFWRLKLATNSGQTLYSPALDFGVDTTPPLSSVNAVFRYPDGRLVVTWHGEDAGSGLVGYNIEYRADGTEEWRSWLHDTLQPGALFVPPQPGVTYWFRSQARDALNWLEPFPTGAGDISTADSILITSQMRLPLLMKE